MGISLNVCLNDFEEISPRFNLIIKEGKFYDAACALLMHESRGPKFKLKKSERIAAREYFDIKNHQLAQYAWECFEEEYHMLTEGKGWISWGGIRWNRTIGGAINITFSFVKNKDAYVEKN